MVVDCVSDYRCLLIDSISINRHESKRRIHVLPIMFHSFVATQMVYQRDQSSPKLVPQIKLILLESHKATTS